MSTLDPTGKRQEVPLTHGNVRRTGEVRQTPDGSTLVAEGKEGLNLRG